MRTRYTALLTGSVMAVGLLAALAIGWPASAQQPRKVDEVMIRNAAKTGEEWLSYNLSPQEQRYSPLKLIDTSNVSKLSPVWSYDVDFGGGGTQEATPIVHDGVIYSITNWSKIFAVDARTGKEKWRFDPQVNQETVRSKICCGIVSRGLAVYENTVIAPILWTGA